MDLETSGLFEADSDETDAGDDGDVSSCASSGPKDPHHLVYIAFVFTGVGFLFPYNTFITAVDYFTFVYPSENAESVMTAVYLTFTLAFVFVNVLIMERFTAKTRIIFGYVVFAVSLLVVMVLTIFLQSCNSTPAFAVTLLAVSATAIACGGQFVYLVDLPLQHDLQTFVAKPLNLPGHT